MSIIIFRNIYGQRPAGSPYRGEGNIYLLPGDKPFRRAGFPRYHPPVDRLGSLILIQVKKVQILFYHIQYGMPYNFSFLVDNNGRTGSANIHVPNNVLQRVIFIIANQIICRFTIPFYWHSHRDGKGIL